MLFMCLNSVSSRHYGHWQASACGLVLTVTQRMPRRVIIILNGHETLPLAAVKSHANA